MPIILIILCLLLKMVVFMPRQRRCVLIIASDSSAFTLNSLAHAPSSTLIFVAFQQLLALPFLTKLIEVTFVAATVLIIVFLDAITANHQHQHSQRVSFHSFAHALLEICVRNPFVVVALSFDLNRERLLKL